jgi:hypothetical protein
MLQKLLEVFEPEAEPSGYVQAVDDLLVDDELCPEDRTVLEQYRVHLGVSERQAGREEKAAIEQVLRRRLLKALADGQLSPEEDASLGRLRTLAGRAVPVWPEETRQALARARAAWAFAEGPLPTVATRVGLLRGETAHAVKRVSAYESRTRSVGLSYGAVTLSVPIAPGFRFRMGQVGYARQQVKYDHALGDGELIVTSQRLIFRSPERALTARLPSVLHLLAYPDALVVQRTVGKPVTYLFDAEDFGFPLICGRAWRAALAAA